MFDNDTISKLVAGGAGSGIAAWLARATGWQLVFMFAAGLAAAWFVAPSVAGFFQLDSHERGAEAVGFVVGFVALLVLRKDYDVLDGIPAGTVGASLVEWFRKLLGLPAQRPGGGDK